MESVSLKAREGGTGQGEADVVRFSNGQRLSKAVPIAIGGFVLGAASIVIPGVHLISTWAIPLLSLGIAWYFFGKRGSVRRVTGTCPACGEAMDAEGGDWEDPMYVRCDKCEKPIQVLLASPMP
ncbi:MAG: hypothetical protein H6737_12585 [Alphaproteobacteria bacterium]|nr:hypothetical protein [Alphaproteobacteria bacterium]